MFYFCVFINSYITRHIKKKNVILKLQKTLPSKTEIVSDHQGKCFHKKILDMEKRYQGKWHGYEAFRKCVPMKIYRYGLHGVQTKSVLSKFSSL